MECGIVGLPNVGKSTLFNALTSAGAAAANYPFCTIEPNVGIVPVPDTRLAQINTFIPCQKIIPAALRLVDIAGLVKGASEGEGLGNKFLSHIREVDAILHVVRCFSDPDVMHVDGTVDPIRDIGTIETELMLADLQIVESLVDKARRTAMHGDKDAVARQAILERCNVVLNESRPVRSLNPTQEESVILQQLGMISAKRVLFVANVDESDPEGKGQARVRQPTRAQSPRAAAGRQTAGRAGCASGCPAQPALTAWTPLCAQPPAQCHPAPVAAPHFQPRSAPESN